MKVMDDAMDVVRALPEAVRRFERKIAYAIFNVEQEVRENVKTARERDPAARTDAEVLLMYPGVHAILSHRLAHALYQRGHYSIAREISQAARAATGIEIHPAAKIGKRFFIDHGMGVVIGETAEIGDDCTIYQGVTLGGTGKDAGKRHPTLGDNVMVGAGAKVLGPVVIGDNSKIAANAVVLHSVPENSTAVGMPAKVVRRDGLRVRHDLDQIHIPDPVSQELARLDEEIRQLKEALAAATMAPAQPLAEEPAADTTEVAPVEAPAVETLAVVDPEIENDDDDEEEDEDSFDFGDMDLDFFDAVEEAERYAELLEQEKRGEIRIATRYRRSFQSRMIQSQGNVQDYYSEIKNALLSYKGIKSRVSQGYDAFNRGRVHVAKINAKTKMLYLYLAIDPAELTDTKYNFVDVSSKKKYATVPVLLKIKGERKFKHALELIEKLGGETLGLKKMDIEEIDYRIPYATTEELVEAGLVKKLVAAVPVAYGETTVSEETVESVVPMVEEQDVTFVEPADAPAIEDIAVSAEIENLKNDLLK